MELFDLGEGFLLAKFDQQQDYNQVLLDGPWMIHDYYLTVQKWSEEYYLKWVDWLEDQSEWIQTWANALGGKYAKVCIEVELDKEGAENELSDMGQESQGKRLAIVDGLKEQNPQTWIELDQYKPEMDLEKHKLELGEEERT
ncbi:protein of unknown function DUF4283 [Dillenia turbinata]|uniref:DUF4283 domain-containing protein n=1 Tax=Dillenia turbinata TaxID=194707 RepID=A0AAN8ZPY4_9MAGN